MAPRLVPPQIDDHQYLVSANGNPDQWGQEIQVLIKSLNDLIAYAFNLFYGFSRGRQPDRPTTHYSPYPRDTKWQPMPTDPAEVQEYGSVYLPVLVDDVDHRVVQLSDEIQTTGSLAQANEAKIRQLQGDWKKALKDEKFAESKQKEFGRLRKHVESFLKKELPARVADADAHITLYEKIRNGKELDDILVKLYANNALDKMRIILNSVATEIDNWTGPHGQFRKLAGDIHRYTADMHRRSRAHDGDPGPHQ